MAALFMFYKGLHREPQPPDRHVFAGFSDDTGKLKTLDQPVALQPTS